MNLYSWHEPLKIITRSARFKYLINSVDNAYATQRVCPNKDDVFNAFKYCDYQDLKVVIIGQDPYHDIVKLPPNRTTRATGLAFGNNEDTLVLSPSLRNIIKELETDLDEVSLNLDITLKSWAKQGVLLLNTALTVEEGSPESHLKIWDGFAEVVIRHISKAKPGTIFLLWGNHAKKFKKVIGPDCWVFEAAHPSPLSASRGFFGCNHFSKVNDNLHIQGKSEIKWI